MTNKDHVYMQPVPTKDKETIIRALKSIIEKKSKTAILVSGYL